MSPSCGYFALATSRHIASKSSELVEEAAEKFLKNKFHATVKMFILAIPLHLTSDARDKWDVYVEQEAGLGCEWIVWDVNELWNLLSKYNLLNKWIYKTTTPPQAVMGTLNNNGEVKNEFGAKVTDSFLKNT